MSTRKPGKPDMRCWLAGVLVGLLMVVCVGAAIMVSCRILSSVEDEQGNADPVEELRRMPQFPNATAVSLFEDSVNPSGDRKGLLRFMTLEEPHSVEAFYRGVAPSGGWGSLNGTGQGVQLRYMKEERHPSGIRSLLLEGRGGDLLEISFKSTWRSLDISSFSPYLDPATNKDVVEVVVTLEIMERRTSLP